MGAQWCRKQHAKQEELGWAPFQFQRSPNL
jgi:hypothetical protein